MDLDNIIHIRISGKDKARLEAEAENRGLSVAALARMIIRRALRRHGDE